MPRGCTAVGRNSRIHWLSDGSRKDSYTGHPSPFFWYEGSPKVTVYFLLYTKASNGHQYSNKILPTQWGSCPTRLKQRNRGGKRRLECNAGGVKWEKKRLSEWYFGICSWNCASDNRRGSVLEKMVYDFDVVSLQETFFKDMPKSASIITRTQSLSEASRPWYANSSSERS